MTRWVLPVLLLVASPVSANGQAWTQHIAEASTRFGIPEDWIRQVIQAESGGRTVWRGRPIRSHAGAMGLMQLMPETWRAMRVAHGLGADPDDPRDNILAGTAYLRAMYEQFGYPGLFGAYNAGPGRYAEHMASRRRLPTETIRYMAKVTGSTVPTPTRPMSGSAFQATLVFRRSAHPYFVSDAPQARASQNALFFALERNGHR